MFHIVTTGTVEAEVESIGIQASCNSLRSILDLSVSFGSIRKKDPQTSSDVEIFVLEGPRILVRIAKEKDIYQRENKEELRKDNSYLYAHSTRF